MIQVLWEFVVKEEARGRFELVYGPGGEWSKLFARSEGFRGTTLLQDTANPRRYLTIDVWDTEVERNQLLAERKEQVQSLDDTCTEWTDSEADLGTFRILAKATVRPYPGRRRATRRQPRQPPDPSLE